MNRSYLCLSLSLLLLSGCSWRKQVEPSTAVFRDFSLPEIVERLGVPELESMSAGNGYSESLGETVRRRRDFNLTYRVIEREGARFDATHFICQLENEVEKVVSNSDVRTNGSGLSNDSFNFDYSKGVHGGWLEVVGARVEGDQFKLWGVIRENTEAERE